MDEANMLLGVLGTGVSVLIGLCLGVVGLFLFYRQRLQAFKVLQLSHADYQLERERLLLIEQEFQEQKITLHRLQEQYQQQAATQGASDARVVLFKEKIDELKRSEQETQGKYQVAQKTLALSQVREATLSSEIQHLKNQTDEKISLLLQAKESMSESFENVANKIFDDKQQVFTRASTQNLSQTIDPLKTQLSEFKETVQKTYEKESRDRQALFLEITHLKNLNQQMSEDAVNLTRALKGDNKAQGNWGEVILERVLEESGLRKGHEYETQVNLKSEDGQRRAPDVIVRLPENKDVIIDAKVSLVDYEAYCSASTDDEREAHLKKHIQSMRQHVNGLSCKDYENLEGIRTLDFVLVFVPIEAAFVAAVEFDQRMFKEAYEKNIIIVSPTTLLATLRTVQSIWRYERQNKNADEIARQAGGLHDQFVLLIESLEDINKHLAKAQDSYDITMKRLTLGNGNLVGRVNKLQTLGAKSKKNIPEHLHLSK
jgi:DNA recombination protein RmuC